MKKTIYTIMFACAALLFTACSSEDEPARTPVSSINVDKTELVINESMEINFTGIADQVVIFTGDKDHEYQTYGTGDLKENTGVVVNKGYFTYSYAVPGVFHVVVVANTYDTYLGNGCKSDVYEFDVTVKDDINTINQISFTSQAHNVFYAQAPTDKDFVFCVPTNEVYNNKVVKTNVTKRPVAFDIDSDSAKVYIDSELFSSTKNYNLSVNHDLKVVSYEGNAREYKLWAMVYPEFTSIALGGVKGVISRDAYYQDLIIYTFTGVNGKEELTETHEADVEFLVNGAAPGNDVDYANADNVYTLVRTNAENSAVKAVTRVKFIFVE